MNCAEVVEYDGVTEWHFIVSITNREIAINHIGDLFSLLFLSDELRSEINLYLQIKKKKAHEEQDFVLAVLFILPAAQSKGVVTVV